MKNETELFEWLEQQLCNGEERKKDMGSSRTREGNSDIC